VAYFNQDWVATSAFMILMMQVGFAMLEAGCVRYKNTSAIITKVILNTTITVLVWWLVPQNK
jgi:Amt family ammonium transporter